MYAWGIDSLPLSMIYKFEGANVYHAQCDPPGWSERICKRPQECQPRWHDIKLMPALRGFKLWKGNFQDYCKNIVASCCHCFDAHIWLTDPLRNGMAIVPYALQSSGCTTFKNRCTSGEGILTDDWASCHLHFEEATSAQGCLRNIELQIIYCLNLWISTYSIYAVIWHSLTILD